jgi:hypothetical protein
LTPGTAEREGLSRSGLYRAAREGRYERIARGIYLPADQATADWDWLEAVTRRPEATICLTSALAHHDLTDAIPAVLDIAIPRGARLPATESAIAWHSFVVRDIGAVDTDDGVVFDTGAISVQEIREQADYPGLRVRVKASIGPWTGTAAWDVSTGDPIIPAPRRVRIERVLGDPIELLGYAPETSIAEKGVTRLRSSSLTSTRSSPSAPSDTTPRRAVRMCQLARKSPCPTPASRRPYSRRRPATGF